MVKMNHYAKHLSKRSFRSHLSCEHTHTDRPTAASGPQSNR